ncbi:hypothetical protein B0H67DRAFT_257977 [Lasiosphaeris hirsuta]|uniref:Uncharacterized protein n=1 Tax=Lasiosphaeris hirsuta TaxID=260670 RepID=A0AA40DWH4_9PEZI|nr:hypothetical protein B0H67DRAFT_257977 [Lasiosphaeris hirsuta]
MQPAISWELLACLELRHVAKKKKKKKSSRQLLPHHWIFSSCVPCQPRWASTSTASGYCDGDLLPRSRHTRPLTCQHVQYHDHTATKKLKGLI